MIESFRPGGLGSRRAALAGLAAALVLSLSGCAQQETEAGAAQSGEPRILRQIDRPLRPAAADGERVFQDGLARGALSADGAWRVRAEIMHPRLRCATYAVGVRFGSGDADCGDVDWQTDAEFLPSRRQCNNATVIHSGEGVVGRSPDVIETLSCARVMVRCSGACG